MKKNLNQKLINLIEYYNLINANFLLSNNPLKRKVDSTTPAFTGTKLEKLNKKKILVPTTFGSGSDVTRISVLRVNGKKKSFHDDKLFADVSIIDSNFLLNTPDQIKKNSAKKLG